MTADSELDGLHETEEISVPIRLKQIQKIETGKSFTTSIEKVYDSIHAVTLLPAHSWGRTPTGEQYAKRVEDKAQKA